VPGRGGQGEGRVRPGRKGQLKQVKCRVCEEPMNRQSYKVHLKLKHGLDTNDLRDRGGRGPPQVLEEAEAGGEQGRTFHQVITSCHWLD